MNPLDRLIEAVAPRTALKRAQSRAALELVRSYEGAARGRRTDSWKTRSTGANAAARPALRLLRDRSRDLVRNNPHGARGVSVVAANMVGTGIKTTIATPNKKAAKAVQAAYLGWAESTDCDFDGRHDIYGLQKLAARAMVESGEVIIRRRWRSTSGGRFPVQLQVLEADFLDMSRDGTPVTDGGMIIQGVELDRQGRRTALWLYPQHPGDNHLYLMGGLISERVPIEDCIHVFRQDRPGQLRGVPWLAPVMLKLKDYDEYADAQLVRQKIAACFTAFVTDMEGSEQTGATDKHELIDRMEPGLIETLPPGKSITLANPPAVVGYGEYQSCTLHEVAAGLGVPYESLTGDYSQVNFTSGKMARTEFYALLDDWQWMTFIPQFCSGVFGWFVQACALTAIPATGATAKYTPPRRALVDPTREIPAIIKAVRGGLKTLYEAIREAGYEPDEFLAEYGESLKALDKLGIVLDSDARKVTVAGQAQIEPSDNSADDPPPENSNPKAKDKEAA